MLFIIEKIFEMGTKEFFVDRCMLLLVGPPFPVQMTDGTRPIVYPVLLSRGRKQLLYSMCRIGFWSWHAFIHAGDKARKNPTHPFL
jgi:hypothetical protein